MTSDFTKFHKDPKFFKTRITMRSKKTMHGKRWKQKEVYIGPTRAHKFFRKTNVKINRQYNFDVRRVGYPQGVRFKKRRLKGPRGVVFESDSIMKAIFEEYGKSAKRREKQSKYNSSSRKMSQSRLKTESKKTTIRSQADKRDGYTKSKPRPPKPSKPEVVEPVYDDRTAEDDVFWEEDTPQVVEPLTFRAQCYNCYGMMDVPYSDEPVVMNCPSCDSKNMFRESPKPKTPPKPKKKKEKVDTWVVEDSSKDQVTWSGVDTSSHVDEKAVSMNEYGKKLLDQGFYKAALYWFDQALTQDPNYQMAKANREQAQMYLDNQYDKEFKF